MCQFPRRRVSFASSSYSPNFCQLPQLSRLFHLSLIRDHGKRIFPLVRRSTKTQTRKPRAFPPVRRTQPVARALFFHRISRSCSLRTPSFFLAASATQAQDIVLCRALVVSRTIVSQLSLLSSPAPHRFFPRKGHRFPLDQFLDEFAASHCFYLLRVFLFCYDSQH